MTAHERKDLLLQLIEDEIHRLYGEKGELEEWAEVRVEELRELLEDIENYRELFGEHTLNARPFPKPSIPSFDDVCSYCLGYDPEGTCPNCGLRIPDPDGDE